MTAGFEDDIGGFRANPGYTQKITVMDFVGLGRIVQVGFGSVELWVDIFGQVAVRH